MIKTIRITDSKWDSLPDNAKKNFSKFVNLCITNVLQNDSSDKKILKELSIIKKLLREGIPQESKKKIADNDIIELYKSYPFFKEEFEKIWKEEFIPIKIKKKASVSIRSFKSGLNKIQTLSKNNYSIALSILKKSVDTGWTDFFELKTDTQKKMYGDDHVQTVYPGTLG